MLELNKSAGIINDAEFSDLLGREDILSDPSKILTVKPNMIYIDLDKNLDDKQLDEMMQVILFKFK